MSLTSEKILRQAYGRLGIAVRLEQFPPERYMLAANQGYFDGILFGGAHIDEKFSSLVKIPVPLGYDDIVCFSRKNFSIRTWENLKPFTVGILIGMPEIENRTSGVKVFKISTPIQLFKMLEAGRIDIVVLPRSMGMKSLKEIRNSQIAVLPGVLDRWAMYHYLNKKNTAIISQITKILQEMDRKGEIGDINRETENE